MAEMLEPNYRKIMPLPASRSNTKTLGEPMQMIIIIDSEPSKDVTTSASLQGYQHNPQEAWLPITESRNGNTFFAVFHLLCSGIGLPALLLPVAFATLGWAWGIICLSLAFAWQLNTIFILVRLHESVSGIRYSRYMHLALASFGPKLGKLLTQFPLLYNSGSTCIILIITGGKTLDLIFKTLCDRDAMCHAKSLTNTEWFLVFTCLAILIAQLPNLNSIAWVSLIGAITVVLYSTLIWALSITKDRPIGISYGQSDKLKSNVEKFSDVLNALGIIALTFKGHNVILAIQGTLPSSPKQTSYMSMCIGVTISYIVIAMCQYPLAIGGFWAYGNKALRLDLHRAFSLLNSGPLNVSGRLLFIGVLGWVSDTWRSLIGDTCHSLIGPLESSLTRTRLLESSLTRARLLESSLTRARLLESSLTRARLLESSLTLYAMVVFDNLEVGYTSKKNQPCPKWVRTFLRIFCGGLAFFLSVTFPFLGSLAPLVGGATLPLTFAYPCFMWIAMKKPRPNGLVWFINMGLGCLGIVLTVLIVIAAAWTLADKGLKANFYKP
uniref:Amino acid transporter transmembrane domain-containing protein n=1 Tax=Quercus lobata TaxID=97700 RepID=A0A7N2RE10_QUELO